jgi:hypothetical protein
MLMPGSFFPWGFALVAHQNTCLGVRGGQRGVNGLAVAVKQQQTVHSKKYNVPDTWNTIIVLKCLNKQS